MALRSAQNIPGRRILFGPLAEALEVIELPGPAMIVGTERSVGLIDDGAFGGWSAFHRFPGARPHNPEDAVREGRAFAKSRAVRTVVAVGSSAAIDLGKAIVETHPATFVAVPTALGGAEMTRGYGMTRSDGRKVGGVLAAPAPFVVYDESLLTTLGERELGSIGINAWAHTIEAHYAQRQHALGRAAAERAGQDLPELLLRARTDRGEGTHRALFEAAFLAGFALEANGMGFHHALCHALGGLTGIPHGIVNAAVLPHALRANAEIAPAALAAVAHAFRIDDLAAEAEKIARAYALPRTLGALGADAEIISRALPLVLNSPHLQNNPARVESRRVEDVLRAVVGEAT